MSCYCQCCEDKILSDYADMIRTRYEMNRPTKWDQERWRIQTGWPKRFRLFR